MELISPAKREVIEILDSSEDEDDLVIVPGSRFHVTSSSSSQDEKPFDKKIKTEMPGRSVPKPGNIIATSPAVKRASVSRKSALEMIPLGVKIDYNRKKHYKTLSSFVKNEGNEFLAVIDEHLDSLPRSGHFAVSEDVGNSLRGSILALGALIECAEAAACGSRGRK